MNDLCFKYDIERLKCYDQLPENRTKVNIECYPHCLLLSFTDVGYFNYAVCLDHHEINNVLSTAKSFYSQHNVIRHRLLVEEMHRADCHNTLINNGYSIKDSQVLLHGPSNTNTSEFAREGVELEPVSMETIIPFTQDYLTGFGSEQKDVSRVALNFSQLLHNSEIKMYRILDNKKAVGIAALYVSEQKSLFAAGAILPAHRNKGYHRDALLLRLEKCAQISTRQITAWAYAGSKSYNNMLDLGFAPDKTYLVYEK